MRITRLTALSKNGRASLAAGILVALLTTASARAATPEPLTPEDKALVQQATDYLQNLGEVKGRFVQTDPRGAVSHGELYLKRPGRARFAYDPPSGLLVVSDGATVSVFDPRLRTFNHYPLKYTPLSLFLARQIRLDRGVVVTHVTHFSNGFGLTARDARHEARGQITLTFTAAPIRLSDWTMTDARGQTTRVQITGLEPAPNTDPALFELRDPRGPLPMSSASN
jgi:outer membrane lipoprotein-sorting protein